MKKSMIFLIIMLFVISGCGHKTERLNEQSYLPPVIVNQPRLLYPKIAQEKNYTGDTRVLIHISDEGKVKDAKVIESSGYKLLDKAALEFCENLLFKPAERNGQPVEARMQQEVKFNLLDNDFYAAAYLFDLRRLYTRANFTSGKKLAEIQNAILEKHREFIASMKDVLNFNDAIGLAISDNIARKWESYWDAWPLSFLLYHDFLERFPDYKERDSVKTLLKNALIQDVRYIKSSPVNSNVTPSDEDVLLYKIEEFMKTNYPGIKIDSLNIYTNVNS